MRLLAIILLCGGAFQLAHGGESMEGAISVAIGLLLFGIGQARADIRRRKARAGR